MHLGKHPTPEAALGAWQSVVEHLRVMGAQPRTIRKLAKALDVEPEELVKTGGEDAG